MKDKKSLKLTFFITTFSQKLFKKASRYIQINIIKLKEIGGILGLGIIISRKKRLKWSDFTRKQIFWGSIFYRWVTNADSWSQLKKRTQFATLFVVNTRRNYNSFSGKAQVFLETVDRKQCPQHCYRKHSKRCRNIHPILFPKSKVITRHSTKKFKSTCWAK